MIGLTHYLVLSAVLFSTGLLGVLLRRNIILVLMGIEMMLNAANVAFVALSRFGGRLEGQAVVFFVIAVAAAEVAVGLVIVIALFRRRNTLDLDRLTAMRG